MYLSTPLMDSENILLGRKGILDFVIVSNEIYNVFFIEERVNDERYDKLKRILDG